MSGSTPPCQLPKHPPGGQARPTGIAFEEGAANYLATNKETWDRVTVFVQDGTRVEYFQAVIGEGDTPVTRNALNGPVSILWAQFDFAKANLSVPVPSKTVGSKPLDHNAL